MEETEYRRVRLSDYLVEQGVTTDTKAQARLFSAICAGDVQAFHTVEAAPVPIGASTDSVLRNVFRTANKLNEVSALTQSKVVAELKKAALGRDADWNLLDKLVLRVPVVDGRATTAFANLTRMETAMSTNRVQVSVFEKREKKILEVIASLGLNPMAIAPPVRRGGRDGDRRRIFQAVPTDAMGDQVQDATAFSKAFENTWSRMLKKGSIRLRGTV